MSAVALSIPSGGYQAPRLLSSREGEEVQFTGWVVILIALAFAIIWYGSLWAFCVATCGCGHVYSCQAQWGIWAQVVCSP